MKHLKTYENIKQIGNYKFKQYQIGDYVLVNDPKRQIYNEILRISDISTTNTYYYYECDIPNDNDDYDNGLSIMVNDDDIIRKSSLEEVEMLKTTDKYNL